MPTQIGHLDADCFYVSAERVRHSHLRRQPVGVLGNQGACVIAKSYELRECGVKTGMPIWDALPLCPDAIFLKRDFEWYEVLSREMLNLLREVSPLVEYYSIDEMFFDARGIDPYKLRERMLLRIGIPVTIGISTTRTLAKLVSDSAKPFGCQILLGDEQIAEMLHGRPVDEVTGIASRSRRKLEVYGIRTCADFAHAERRLIRWLLTKRGEDLWWELNGQAVTPIQAKRQPHKAISRGGSVGKATTDPARGQAWLIRNLERLIEALDYHGVVCEQLVLALEFKDGSAASGRVSLPCATAQFENLVPAAEHLLKQCWNGQPLAYLHLLAERLSMRGCRQLGLFDQPSEHQKRIATVKREINERHGRFIVRSGATLTLADVYCDESNAYDICDVQGKTCF